MTKRSSFQDGMSISVTFKVLMVISCCWTPTSSSSSSSPIVSEQKSSEIRSPSPVITVSHGDGQLALDISSLLSSPSSASSSSSIRNFVSQRHSLDPSQMFLRQLVGHKQQPHIMTLAARPDVDEDDDDSPPPPPPPPSNNRILSQIVNRQPSIMIPTYDDEWTPDISTYQQSLDPMSNTRHFYTNQLPVLNKGHFLFRPDNNEVNTLPHGMILGSSSRPHRKFLSRSLAEGDALTDFLMGYNTNPEWFDLYGRQGRSRPKTRIGLLRKLKSSSPSSSLLSSTPKSSPSSAST